MQLKEVVYIHPCLWFQSQRLSWAGTLWWQHDCKLQRRPRDFVGSCSSSWYLHRSVMSGINNRNHKLVFLLIWSCTFHVALTVFCFDIFPYPSKGKFEFLPCYWGRIKGTEKKFFEAVAEEKFFRASIFSKEVTLEISN